MNALVYLLGAAQGVFLAAVLAGRKPRTTPNGLLAIAMAVFSLDLVMAWYHTTGHDQGVPQFIGIDAPIGFLYGPLWFLYARTLTSPAHQLRRIDYLHLIPFAVATALMLPFFAADGAEKLAAMAHPTNNVHLTRLAWLSPLKIGFGALYIGAVMVLITRHQRRILDTHSVLDRNRLGWVRDVTIGFVVLLVLTSILTLFGRPVVEHPVGMDPSTLFDDIPLLAMAGLVYVIGFLGLRQPEILLPPENPPSTASPGVEKPSYAKSGMEADTARQLKDRLCDLMEQKHLYRNGQLTLVELAGALGVSPHNLTEVLNTQLELSFYDFVNGYRVREARQKLDDPSCAHLTILAIGLDAGFNAKSSFNAVFKKHTGLTPSAYRDRYAGHQPAGLDPS